jgi:hypothetical protein
MFQATQSQLSRPSLATQATSSQRRFSDLPTVPDYVPDEANADKSPYLSIPLLQALQTLTTALRASVTTGWMNFDVEGLLEMPIRCCTEQLKALHAASNAR